MFIAGSDFDGKYPDKTIYEQLLDPACGSDLASLYIYAVYWVLTVVTTVGYGHATYQTNTELLYTCFLEVIATLAQAAAITVLMNVVRLDKYDFKHLLRLRIDQAD